jgi:phage replication-related protein YjqB (UPF0714/DUF867 family)
MTAELSALLARPDVRERCELRSRFGFMAFHGGLEAGTDVLAEAAAERAGASLYTIVQPPDLRWHVPSHRVTPDESQQLGTFLAHVDVVVALHGYGRRDRRAQVLLGGQNRVLARRMSTALAVALPQCTIVDDLRLIPAELRGIHPRNPVNRPAGGGVQVELPPFARTAPGLIDALSAVAATWCRNGDG